MLVVSGRPQIASDQLHQVDALVASWLPGSEGARVADVLFGRRPFTGQLPVSWPRSAEQVPVNVGDDEYDPQFPFGWGLTTGSDRERLRQALAGAEVADTPARQARTQLTLALASRNWRADGTVLNEQRVVNLLGRAVVRLQASQGETTDLQAAAVAVVRDLAQAAVVADRAPADAARMIADADVALLSGDADRAVALLREVAGL